MAEIKLSIEQIFPIIARANISKIIVIGCGGTGSFYIRDMARLVSSLKYKPEILLVDGDVVESKNLIRQNFVSVDIGKNKADVQAGRYGGLGVKMAFRGEYLASKDQLKEMGGTFENVLLVSCVDNIKTRLLIREALAEVTPAQMFWIDCGNEEESGQVILSVKSGTWVADTIKAGLYPTPDVFDLYPELIERAQKDKLPTEMNCAEMAVASPQFGFVNGTAAMLAINFTHRLLTQGQIKVYESCFSIDNRFSHKTTSLSTLKSWVGTFKPFTDVNLENLEKK